jgi:hypothetical protein
MYALPHTYRNVDAAIGTTVQVIITTEIGGEWIICKQEQGWHFVSSISTEPNGSLSIDPNTAWKLFSKSMQPADALPFVELAGDKTLAANALQMVSVMA